MEIEKCEKGRDEGKCREERSEERQTRSCPAVSQMFNRIFWSPTETIFELNAALLSRHMNKIYGVCSRLRKRNIGENLLLLLGVRIVRKKIVDEVEEEDKVAE